MYTVEIWEVVMAILIADILTFVNEALNEQFAAGDIEVALKTTLSDLSKYNLLTATPVESAKVSGDTTIDFPTLFKKLIAITPNDGTLDRNPLIAFGGGYKEYRRAVSGTQVNANVGQMLYAQYNKKFYVYPTLTQSITFTIDYYQHSARDVDNIAFGDEFENAINYGTTYHKALFKKKVSYVDIWLPIYLAERGTMIAMNPPQPSIVGN